MLRIEIISLTIIFIFVAFVCPGFCRNLLNGLQSRLAQLSHRRTLSVVLVGVLALGLRLAILPLEPVPEPIVHDEFAYLLSGDTLAHGRLTNPTPAFWEHFESFGIILKPTYQCFGQPGHGIVHAFGQRIFGHPFWGVWLIAGVMCSAITWMLQAWVGDEWA